MKAILFDLDGTLVHTSFDFVALLVNKILNELGARPPSADAITAFWYGTHRNEIITKVFQSDAASFWHLYQQYHTIDVQRPHTRLYDDINAVQNLRSLGYKTAIVTGALPSIAEFEISLLGKGLFDDITLARASHGSAPKPDPHCVNFCLQKLGVSAKDAVFVGNADEDILTARGAGVLDVIVDRKEHKLTEKPTHIINSLHEIPAVIERHKINKD